MDEILQNVVAAACDRDPQLGSEWYELLGKSTPSPDNSDWTDLVDRLTRVADDAGVRAEETEGLMDALVAQYDTAELQAAIAAILWPETTAAAEEPDGADADMAQEGQAASTDDPEALAAAMAQEDPNAWNTYLLTNGPAWDGTDESWPTFAEWFNYYANEQGVGASARSFCDYAAANGAREVFAQYGVALNVPDAAESAPEPMTVEDAVATYGPELFAEFRASYPDLADTSDDELRGVLTELLNERRRFASAAG
jgi:hypothetical protein